MRVALYPGAVITNIGLTAWGRSGARNFVGFAAVGFHRLIGKPTKVIVHHAIEIFDAQETGYPVSRIVRMGAHSALRRVARCDLIVFTPRLMELLTRQYGARRVWLVPLPGEESREIATAPSEGQAKVVSAGYWAPYKGIGLFIQLANRMRSRGEFVLVGDPHLGLSKDPMFRQKVEEWRSEALRAGVRTTGFLPPSGLDEEFSGPTLGILPYTSASGASASFQLFAERGVPVVASDLPEFRYLERCGAGVMIAPATVDGLEEAVRRVLDDPVLWRELARRQVTFNARYSWGNFVSGVFGNPGGPSPHVRA
jgi:glycosyltransferase involved in cell wall biosynthesis